MAITANDPRQPRLVPANDVPQIMGHSLEANSQSFLAGEFVYSNAGAITETTAGDKTILGIALKSATNVTSSNIVIPVAVINPHDEIYIQVEDGSGNLEAANTTCASGTAYDVILSSNHWRIDSSDITNPKFVFIEALYDSAGDATYWGRFKPYYLENQATAE